MSFIGSFFGGYAARQAGRYNQQLFNQQALIEKSLKPREISSHKGPFGHVLVIAGNHGMGGAARITSEAALRTGAGLVSVITRAQNIEIISKATPEIMAHSITSDSNEILELIEKADVIAVGPGLGQDQWAKDLFKVATNLTNANNGTAISLTSEGTLSQFFIGRTATVTLTETAGVVDGFTIKMKVVYSHFPITVKVEGKKVLIENFQGERAPRICVIRGNTNVDVKGDDVIITGPVLTDVSQTAANVQQKSKVKNKDHRVFLDGIYRYSDSKGIEK